MPEQNSVETRVRRQLNSFLTKSGIRDVKILANTNLMTEVGLTSLQGLEFVLELCDEFQFDFPKNFNPFVDDNRRRGQTFGGLIKAVEECMANDGASNAKK